MKARRLNFDPRSKEPFELKKAIERLAHWLPSQGPVKDFIHQHPLHGFQNQPFEDSVWQASRMFGAFAYMPAAYYQHAYRDGRLLKSELERIFDLRQSPMPLREKALRRLESRIDEPLEQPPKGLAKDGLRSRWKASEGVDLESLVQPLLFKLLSAYLDQGISTRRFPSSFDFYEGVGNLVRDSWLPLAPLSDSEIVKQFAKPSEEVILFCLEKLVGDSTLYERYLHEVFLSHPGWYAMVYMIDHDPKSLMARRQINLEQVLAVELLMEVGWMWRKRGAGFRPLGEREDCVVSKESAYFFIDDCLALWHEAFEWTHYSEVLRALVEQAKFPRSSTSPVSAQAFFCIDDRECSIRRYLEELDPQLQTFGTAGFFAIDFMFQGLNDSHPVKQCPLPVTARFLVREVLPDKKKRRKDLPSHRFHLQTRATNTLIRGWLTAQVLGIWSGVKLVISIVKPSLAQPTLSALSRIDAYNDLALYRKGDEKSPEGYWVGYSLSEMVDRVATVLKFNHLVKDFAEVIVMVAHGSSSTNNPHFAAYDCGACSGRAGAPNARAFAIMANDPQVRKGLSEKGIDVPVTTRFIGAIHDTAREEVDYFDVGGLTPSQSRVFEGFRTTMEKALAMNAVERCRRFELVPEKIGQKKALEEVQKRSAALFEPRPELNHATNSLTIVGRRPITYGLFLDRRALLQSYNPLADLDGKILQSLLGALVPVCGGINLQYVFSRIDNEVYGAGTKLPHNVSALLGVANGVEGDLRTGLPAQMVEIHDPIRLLMVVEQEAEIALAALKREPALFEWVENGWMRYATISPSTHEISLFFEGKMISVDVSAWPKPPTAKNSAALLARGSRNNLPVVRLGGEW